MIPKNRNILTIPCTVVSITFLVASNDDCCKTQVGGYKINYYELPGVGTYLYTYVLGIIGNIADTDKAKISLS